MVKSLGSEEPAMRTKALALEIFRGHKQWNCARRFESNYLEKPSNPLHLKCPEAFGKIFKTHGDSNVIFADYINKINNKGKVEKRGILMTNLHIFKLHPKTFKIRRKEIPLVSVQSISLSPYKDAAIVFHIKAPDRDLLIDASIAGYEAVSEIVTVTVEQIMRIHNVRIPVNYSTNIVFNNSRPAKKDYTLTFQPVAAGSTPGVKKVKDNYISTYPA